MKTRVVIVALSLAFGIGICEATSIKWTRNVVVGFAPGSTAPDSGTSGELRKLIDAARESCDRYGIEVLALVEIMQEVPRGAGAMPTPRTSEVRRLLQALGASAIVMVEGAAPIAKQAGQRVVGPQSRSDSVEIELVCGRGH